MSQSSFHTLNKHMILIHRTYAPSTTRVYKEIIIRATNATCRDFWQSCMASKTCSPARYHQHMAAALFARAPSHMNCTRLLQLQPLHPWGLTWVSSNTFRVVKQDHGTEEHPKQGEGIGCWYCLLLLHCSQGTLNRIHTGQPPNLMQTVLKKEENIPRLIFFFFSPSLYFWFQCFLKHSN